MFSIRAHFLIWSYQACNYSYKLVTCMATNLILDEIKLLKLSKVQACQLTSIDLIFSIKGPFSNLDLSSMQQQQIVTCMATNLNPNYSRSNLD